MPAFSTVMWALGAIILFFVLWFVGTGMLRSVTTALPPPPPEGELRKVNVRYRCSLCGRHFFLFRWRAPLEGTA